MVLRQIAVIGLCSKSDCITRPLHIVIKRKVVRDSDFFRTGIRAIAAGCAGDHFCSTDQFHGLFHHLPELILTVDVLLRKFGYVIMV